MCLGFFSRKIKYRVAIEPNVPICLQCFLSLTEKEQHNYLINENEDKIINMKNNCLSCSSMENTKIILPLNKDNVTRTRKPHAFSYIEQLPER